MELATAIEAGVLAQAVLDGEPRALEAAVPATRDELEIIAAEGRRACEELFFANLGLVHMAVSEVMRTHPGDRADTFQQGCVALMRAIIEFDHRRGAKFCTLALPCIRRDVRDAARHSRSLLATATRRLREIDMVIGVRFTLQGQGLAADEAAVARAMGRSRPWVRARWVAPARVHARFEPPDEQGDAAPQGEDLHQYLGLLTDVERTALILRFGLGGEEPQTYGEVATALGMKRAPATRLIRVACERLKCLMEGREMRRFGGEGAA